MRVAVVGTVGVPANYGGFETLVENLLTYKVNEEIIYTVYCSKPNYTNKIRYYKGAKLVYLPFRANGFQSIIYDIVSVFHAMFHADIILILGVSGCVILPIVRLFTKKHIIVNIDGLEHKRQKWGKWTQRFLRFSEKMAIGFASEIVADNKGIQDYVFSEYDKDVELIEYGGDQLSNGLDNEYFKTTNLQNLSYFFSVCRIEPENNTHILLEAFARMPNEKIVVVGNWDKTIYSRNLEIRYSNYENIHLLPAIYDDKKLNSLRINAQAYLHGHSAGGTNPSLVEGASKQSIAL